MGEKDLKYLAAVIFLANRGGVVTEHDMDIAIKVSEAVYKKVFEVSD